MTYKSPLALLFIAAIATGCGGPKAKQENREVAESVAAPTPDKSASTDKSSKPGKSSTDKPVAPNKTADTSATTDDDGPSLEGPNNEPGNPHPPSTDKPTP